MRAAQPQPPLQEQDSNILQQQPRWLWAAAAGIATLGVLFLVPSRTIGTTSFFEDASAAASVLHRRLRLVNNQNVQQQPRQLNNTAEPSLVSITLDDLNVNLRGLTTPLSQDAIDKFITLTEQAFELYYLTRRRLRGQDERGLKVAKGVISNYSTKLVFEKQRVNDVRVRLYYNQTMNYTLNEGYGIPPERVAWEPVIFKTNRDRFIQALKGQSNEFQNISEIDSSHFDSVDDTIELKHVSETLEDLYMNLHNVSYELSPSAMAVFGAFVTQAYVLYYQQDRRLRQRSLLAKDEITNYATVIRVKNQEPNGDNQVRVYYDQDVSYTIPTTSDLTAEDVAWEPVSFEVNRIAFIDHLSNQHSNFSNLTAIDAPFFENVEDLDPEEVEVPDAPLPEDNNFGSSNSGSDDDREFDKKGILYIIVAASLTVVVFGIGWWNLRRLQALDRIEDARLLAMQVELGLHEEEQDTEIGKKMEAKDEEEKKEGEDDNDEEEPPQTPTQQLQEDREGQQGEKDNEEQYGEKENEEDEDSNEPLHELT